MIDIGVALGFLYVFFGAVGAFLLFLGFVWLLSLFQVFWAWVWNDKVTDDE